MRKVFAALTGLALLSLFTSPAQAQSARVDSPAPDFTLTDSKGESHSLSDFKGKYVVLEWVNYDCPFVRKHYRSGNMQELQKHATGEGVVWLSICSSAPGKQGHFEGSELTERIADEKATPTAYLIDSDGKVGRMYDAKTTPHMFVVNPEGTLIYAGAIDNTPSTDKEDIPKSTNYVMQVLDESTAGKPLSVKGSKPYGCSVKYR